MSSGTSSDAIVTERIARVEWANRTHGNDFRQASCRNLRTDAAAAWIAAAERPA